MNITKKEQYGRVYLEGTIGKRLITSENDALDVIAVCGEHETSELLLNVENLDERFFDLKTQFAGTILQKFMNYGIRAALVVSTDFMHMQNARFKEMALEAKRNRHFRIFHNSQEAQTWLLGEVR